MAAIACYCLAGSSESQAQAAASLSPSPLAFSATTIQQGNELYITLRNSGTAPLSFTGSTPFTITGANVFSVYPNGSCTGTYVDFGTDLPAGSSCTIGVQFWPNQAGEVSATVSIADNAANSPQTVTITGIGASGLLQFIPGLLDTAAGTYGTPGEAGDSGLARAALLNGGFGAAFDTAGNFYFSDNINNTVRKIDTSGYISVYAGAPYTSDGDYSGDNGPAASARLNIPMGIATDAAGNLYIADMHNCVVRKVNTAGVITTFAGNYQGNAAGGYGGDDGPATNALMNEPSGIAVDTLGNVYIADQVNDIVRKVDTNGKITRFAGIANQPGYTGNTGQATLATLNQPYMLATDLAGNLYIVDGVNKVVRRVDNTGIITTYAGGGNAAVTTTPQSATAVSLNAQSMATDPAGNLYIADHGQLFVVNTSQQISLIEGGGASTSSGIPALAASLNDSGAVAVDAEGDVFINDPVDNVIDEIGPQGSLQFDTQNVGTTGAPLSLTLTNSGNAAVNFYNPSDAGFMPGTSLPAASLPPRGATSGISIGGGVGTISGDFALASGGSCNLTAGGSIAAGSSCTVNVTFSPTATGGRAGTITFYTDEPYASHTGTVQLSGTGTSILNLPTVTLTPSLTFTATTGTTTTAKAATLSNTGGVAVTISGISISGTNPSDFAITTGANACGASLGVESTCSIYVTFTPASAASFAATLSVADNAGGSPQTTSLSGTGSAPANYTVAVPTPKQSVQPGATASFTINVVPVNGAYSSMVTLAASGLPAGATASFNPASVMPGSTGATSQLTIQTAAVNTTASTTGSGWILAAPLGLLGLLCVPGRRRGRLLMRGVLLFALLGALTALSGCGGGFSLPTSGTTVSAAKSYTITVTGTSGVEQQITTVQLTVQ
jgi:sugar lactone lactonase YvrE